MKKRSLPVLLALALTMQLFSFTAAAEDSFLDDPTYWKMSQSSAVGDQLYEETEVTFDTYRPRALKDNESLHRGVDVSEWQGKIDWEAVKNDGVEFVFVRVGARGYGSSGRIKEDENYKTNIQGALNAGLKVGVYIFSQAITPEEAVEEAKFLLDRIGDYDISLPLVFDYEYAGNPGRLEAAELTKKEATDIWHAFEAAVEAKGYQATLYANKYFLNNQLNAKDIDSVWLAHYIVETDYTGNYEFWQFTSSGKVKGISGKADLDFWFMDFPFRDVTLTHWAYESICYAYERGYVNGLDKNSFAPDTNATRGQMITMLYRMMGSPAVTQPSTFLDLTESYYMDAIAWGQQNGIVNGRSETRYDPDAYVSRQEFVTMLYRLAGKPESTYSLSAFMDAEDISEYAVSSMSWAVEQGIIRGESDTLLNPEGYATRAQIATILMRYDQIRN